MNTKSFTSFSFQSSKFLSLLLFVFFSYSCSKDCEDIATCHTYQDNTCTDKRTENAPVIAQLKEEIIPITGSQPDLPKEELANMDATFEQAYALHVNRYVVDGIGSAKESVRKMQFWTWRTEEVVALVEWIRSYNLDKADEDKVRFYGVDVQSGSEEVLLISDYLKRVAPDLEEQITTKLAALVDAIGVTLIDLSAYRAMADAEKIALRAGVIDARNLFQSNANRLIESSSQKEYDLVRHAFLILRQFEEVMNDDNLNTNPRDGYMARNSEWIRTHLGGEVKVALWAHNSHIGKGSTAAQGGELAKLHGEAYQAVGFSFSTGSFQALQPEIGLTVDNEILSPNCVTTNALLSEVGSDNFYIVFDDLPNQSVASTYFSTPNRMFSLGAVFNPENVNGFISSLTLSDNFDILIHFDDTNAAVPY